MDKLEKFFDDVQIHISNNPQLRAGQAMMAVLAYTDKDLYLKIASKGDCDPFYNDKRLPAFCSILVTAWKGQKA
jgi:hypothetical protein